ncbi:hypothetical protein NXX53_06640 [Bacteroides salyersiae]|uniref:hypothetical protein n=1 Tax=Bacteroides sp. TaxID=29523 RepID=UPI0025C5E10D|nr:hypothetical protein [Bacteroides sp.]MCS2956954.1 hypothetical protein [Bacteroides salyersiae]
MKKKERDRLTVVHEHTESDGLEIWKALYNGKKECYVARDTLGGNIWSLVIGEPDGYLELDGRINSNVDIIICDKTGKEHYRDGNNRELYPVSFPTLEQVCTAEWDMVKSFHAATLTTQEHADWLTEKMPPNVEYLQKLNWTTNYHTITATHYIRPFSYIGIGYCILRVDKKHNLCNASWSEFYVAIKVDGKYQSNVFSIGIELDNNLFHPKIEFTDPDTLQFCITQSEARFWYCEFDQFALHGSATERDAELFDKYEGHPAELIRDAATDEEVKKFILNKHLWISTTIDAGDLDEEERKVLFDTYGMSADEYEDPQDLNQIIAEMYFETNIDDFRNEY